MADTTDLDIWRVRWQRAKLPVHPLQPDSKIPALVGWQTLPPDEQWSQVEGRDDLNVGVMPGCSAACIDGDSQAAAAAIGAGLRGLGVGAVIENTPQQGHQHFWVRVAGLPAGDVHLLAPAIGAGELRTRRANVVVTCSAIGGRRYEFVTVGGPEALAGLPVVRFKDLLWLLPVSVGLSPALPPQIDELPVRVLWRDGLGAVAMLRELCGWPAATTYLSYQSASEAEAAAVARLILAGWDYSQVAAAFECWQPGAYRRRGTYRGRYLSLTWRKVLSHLAQSAPRPAVATAWQNVQSMAFSGRGGPLDKAVLSGLLSMAWVAKSWQPGASVRDLALYAAASVHGVHNALSRLAAAGLIRRIGVDPETLSGLWDCSPVVTSGNIRHSARVSGEPGANEAEGEREDEGGGSLAGAPTLGSNGDAEIWSQRLLGRPAGEVYRFLCEAPAAVAELAGRSGRPRITVYRVLARLETLGLAVLAPAGWVRGAADPGGIGQMMGAPARSAARRERYGRERERWSRVKAWAVAGCLAWQREGLQVPTAVKAATEAYRAESDTLGQFLAECTTIEGANLRAQAGPLFSAYLEWCKANNERDLTRGAFGRGLVERGFDKIEDPHTRKVLYLGLGLRAQSSQGSKVGQP